MLAVCARRTETAALFLLGGCGYLGLELAWRGGTHWTMFFAGGVSLCLLHWLDRRLAWPLPAVAALASGGISGLELVIGLYTRGLGLCVWDYSAEWGNLAGLVCPKYSLLWFLLCLWLLGAIRTLRRLTKSR